jgi:Rrf2 family protein
MFSQTAQYALRAMTYLASLRDSAANSERISTEMKIPKPYLSKILSDLVRAGLVIARRGPNGGFAIGNSPNRITILDVLSAVDPIERIRECPLGNPQHTTLCPLHKRLDDAICLVESSLAATKLSELVEHRRPSASIRPRGKRRLAARMA